MKQTTAVRIDSQYIVGIPGIDDQHNDLFMQFTALLDYLEKENRSFDYIYASLQKITEALETHFSTEESLMEMICFTGIENHKNQHNRLHKQLSDISDTLSREKDVQINQSLYSLRDAKLEHIASGDAEYAVHIENLMALKQKFNITAVKAQSLTK